jgi:hypothetical protein
MTTHTYDPEGGMVRAAGAALIGALFFATVVSAVTFVLFGWFQYTLRCLLAIAQAR